MQGRNGAANPNCPGRRRHKAVEIARKPSRRWKAARPARTNFRAAAEAALRGAKPLHDNAFKVELAKRTLTRALKVATQAA